MWVVKFNLWRERLVEEINTFIIFDIYEIDTQSNSNENISNNNINITENFSYVKQNKEEPISSTNKNNSKNDKIYFNGDIKLIYEDIQMKGFYGIFYKDNFESEKVLGTQ